MRNRKFPQNPYNSSWRAQLHKELLHQTITRQKRNSSRRDIRKWSFSTKQILSYGSISKKFKIFAKHIPQGQGQPKTRKMKKLNTRNFSQERYQQKELKSATVTTKSKHVR
ncbi:hypothetical protein V6Z12_A11G083700 [Gossypium hirsutum]